jgi:hypothetical protein
MTSNITFLSLLLLTMTGCAMRPAIVEVSATTRRNMVEAIDEKVFLQDRASRLDAANVVLSPDEQRQQFFISWRPRSIDEVRFEYRQVNVPEKIAVQSFKPVGEASHVFAIRGDDFLSGGAVSAWHVGLWQNQQLVGERASALW